MDRHRARLGGGGDLADQERDITVLIIVGPLAAVANWCSQRHRRAPAQKGSRRSARGSSLPTPPMAMARQSASPPARQPSPACLSPSLYAPCTPAPAPAPVPAPALRCPALLCSLPSALWHNLPHQTPSSTRLDPPLSLCLPPSLSISCSPALHRVSSPPPSPSPSPQLLRLAPLID